MTFEQHIDRLEKFLKDKCKIVRENKNSFFAVSDGHEFHSPIYICDQGGTIHVGIGDTYDYFDKPKEQLDKAVLRFLTLLTCKIERTDYFKGNNLYKSTFILPDNKTDSYNQASYRFPFPFWKKTKTNKIIQLPIITASDIETHFGDLTKGNA
ncbi:MAG TPA: hypothetical protein VK177_04495 [Flavobacteriales bacterium]|nr:hypothetical protein [Flavobacteriales bacterium]